MSVISLESSIKRGLPLVPPYFALGRVDDCASVTNVTAKINARIRPSLFIRSLLQAAEREAAQLLASARAPDMLINLKSRRFDFRVN